jgi:hypothetical protein
VAGISRAGELFIMLCCSPGVLGCWAIVLGNSEGPLGETVEDVMFTARGIFSISETPVINHSWGLVESAGQLVEHLSWGIVLVTFCRILRLHQSWVSRRHQQFLIIASYRRSRLA